MKSVEYVYLQKSLSQREEGTFKNFSLHVSLELSVPGGLMEASAHRMSFHV